MHVIATLDDHLHDPPDGLGDGLRGGWLGRPVAHPRADQLGRGEVDEGRLDPGATDIDAQRQPGQLRARQGDDGVGGRQILDLGRVHGRRIALRAECRRRPADATDAAGRVGQAAGSSGCRLRSRSRKLCGSRLPRAAPALDVRLGRRIAHGAPAMRRRRDHDVGPHDGAGVGLASVRPRSAGPVARHSWQPSLGLTGGGRRRRRETGHCPTGDKCRTTPNRYAAPAARGR